MRSSELGENNTGTARHAGCINVGEAQPMNFCIDDLPPGLKPLCPKFPAPTGKTTTRDLNVSELKAQLEAKGGNPDGKQQASVQRSIEAGLPVKLTFPVMTPGCVGQPKGAAHITFECGLFHASLKLPNGKKVSFAGSKVQEAEAAELIMDEEAVVATAADGCKKRKPKVKRDKETSAREILKRCDDFANETPQLEFVAQKFLWCIHPSHTQVPSQDCWKRN
jgi:hypothetical protein